MRRDARENLPAKTRQLPTPPTTIENKGGLVHL